MKKIIITLFLYPLCIFTQDFGKIDYEFTFNLNDGFVKKNKDNKNIILYAEMLMSGKNYYENGNYVLNFNKSNAYFTSEFMNIDDNTPFFKNNSSFFTYPEIFIDSSKTFYIEKVFGKEYYIEFEKNSFIIHDEYKFISELKVQKATFNLNLKQSVEVWFLPEKKIPFGPTIFQHLPGLVLEVTVKVGELYSYSFKAKKISFENTKVKNLDFDSNIEIMKYSDLEKMYKDARSKMKFGQ